MEVDVGGAQARPTVTASSPMVTIPRAALSPRPAGPRRHKELGGTRGRSLGPAARASRLGRLRNCSDRDADAVQKYRHRCGGADRCAMGGVRVLSCGVGGM